MKSRDKTARYKSLTAFDIAIANRNMKRCLDALEKDGEAGLQKELDRMYPGTTATPLEESIFDRRQIEPGVTVLTLEKNRLS